MIIIPRVRAGGSTALLLFRGRAKSPHALAGPFGLAGARVDSSAGAHADYSGEREGTI